MRCFSSAFVSSFASSAFVILAIGSSVSPAFGWGCEGHQMVALLARVHLTPVATNAVDQLLRENPVDTASPYCKSAVGDLMAEVASWADNVRNAEKTGPWHYIDIPLGSHDGDLSQWCQPIGESVDGKDRPGCVTNAIAYEAAILSATGKPSAERAKALRYIIHFIGDMHQPLHTTDNNDHGGNCTSFPFYAEEHPSNLHSIWDTRMISKELGDEHMTPAQYATKLDAQFGGEWRNLAGGTVTDWAWDGHRIAEQTTYGGLVPKIPVETPNPQADCNAERAKVAALQIRIDDRYFKASMPVVDQQLAKAGYRLAGFLNQILTK